MIGIVRTLYAAYRLRSCHAVRPGKFPSAGYKHSTMGKNKYPAGLDDPAGYLKGRWREAERSSGVAPRTCREYQRYQAWWRASVLACFDHQVSMKRPNKPSNGAANERNQRQ